MPIQETPRWNNQESTQEAASPFLSEEIFNTTSDITEELTTDKTWYQSESPFLHAFEPKDQDVMIKREAEEYEADTDGGALAEDLVDEPEGEEEAADTDFSTNESEELEPEALAELDEARYDEEIDPKEDEEFEESALQTHMEERLRGARETRELGLNEYQVPSPKKIEVRRWVRSLNVSFVYVTAAARVDNVNIQGLEKDGVHPLVFNRPKTLGIRAGELVKVRAARPPHDWETINQDGSGQVNIDLSIRYKGLGKVPRSSKVASGHFVLRSLQLPFSCTAEGNIMLDSKVLQRQQYVSRVGRAWRLGPIRDDSSPLSVHLKVYHRRDKPTNRGMDRLPSSVWEAWLKQVRTLRIVIIAELTASENGPGWYSLTCNDESVPIPLPMKAGSTGDYSTGDYTAQLDPMIIDLVPVGARPPLTAPQGLLYRVLFGVDSDKIDRIVKDGAGVSVHQGNALDAWIRNNLVSRWDVREALLRGDLPVYAEARASATAKGMSDTKRHAHNKVLSKKRLVAAVNRLKRTLAGLDRDMSVVKIEGNAIGDEKALKVGEETVNERYCEIRIEAVDLEKAIKKLYRPPYWSWWTTIWE